MPIRGLIRHNISLVMPIRSLIVPIGSLFMPIQGLIRHNISLIVPIRSLFMPN